MVGCGVLVVAAAAVLFASDEVVLFNGSLLVEDIELFWSGVVVKVVVVEGPEVVTFLL